LSRKLYSAALVLLLALVSATSAHAKNRVPSWFVEQALCVHSGWHYTSHRIRGAAPGYVLWGHGYWRTVDVPDYVAGGSGEGSWSGVVGGLYGGGLSFMVGTWNAAGAPFVGSTSDIAAMPPSVQIEHAYRVVHRDHSWAEWPQTARACGYL
jgi:hypothetical protein